MRRILACAALATTIAGLGAAGVQAGQEKPRLPAIERQPTAAAVVREHFDALNDCDLQRLVAQYPNRAQFHLNDGKDIVVLRGRRQIYDLFAGFVKPYPEGLCGLKFTPERTFSIDDTLVIQFRVTAPFLAKTYRGSDAYVTKGGLMVGQVSTFEGTDLKFKRR